jgi:hypothetical protein
MGKSSGLCRRLFPVGIKLVSEVSGYLIVGCRMAPDALTYITLYHAGAADAACVSIGSTSLIEPATTMVVACVVPDSMPFGCISIACESIASSSQPFTTAHPPGIFRFVVFYYRQLIAH